MRCRSCSAPIFFVVGVNGQRIPLDHVPNEKGNVVIEKNLLDESYARVLGPGEDAASEKFMPHWATCNDPERFRKH